MVNKDCLLVRDQEKAIKIIIMLIDKIMHQEEEMKIASKNQVAIPS